MRASTARSNVVVVVILRIAGAALLLGMAYIHFHLYQAGYYLTAVGPAFIANAVVALLGAIAVLVLPNRFLALMSTLGSLLSLGTLAALLISLFGSLFGYTESPDAPLLKTTFVVESAGVVVLAVLAVLAARQFGMWKWRPARQ
ncbi:MAG TPA: hypothetical protein VHV49_01035 [Pseudonocardiaceae bacterium]|jgi:hypothetical protein|nr:hypothetical protein [Pseudonocardiaceae bacterium]